MLKNAPPSGNQRPDLLTSLINNMSLVLLLARGMPLVRPSSNAPRLPLFLDMLQNSHVLLAFEKVHDPLRLPRKTAPEPPKVVQARSVLNVLTWKRSSCHTGVHFLNMFSSKSARCSALCATMACNSSSLIWPDGSAPAALASLPLDPPEPQIIGKIMFARLDLHSSDFLFFELLWVSLSFFLLLFSSLPLPISAFFIYRTLPYITVQYRTRPYITAHCRTLH